MSSSWTRRELTILRRDYPHRPTAQLARKIPRHSLTAIYQRARILGLTKNVAYLAGVESGRISKLNLTGHAYRFQKGHKTWNKGLHVDIGGKETRFRTGNRPQTWRPVGSQRVDRDGILWRKVSDTRNKRADWRQVHVLTWEAVHGPLPIGKIVIFSDHDRRNFALSNLLAVTRAEHMRRITYHRYPKELARLIQLRGALNRQINKRERNAQQDR